MADYDDDERMYALHRLLKAGRPVVASQLAQGWNCSTRSLSRTLHKMQGDGLPLDYDPRKKKWIYTGDVDVLPAGLVSAEDRRALLFALRATGNLEGLPVGPAVERLYQKLLATLPAKKAGTFAQAVRHIHFAGPKPPTVRPDVWACILLSLEDRTRLRISYVDGGYGSPTSRDIDPYALIMRDRRWILLAYCHKAADIRTFALHRIGEISMTDDNFEVSDRRVQELLRNSYGGYPSSADVQTVRLQIPKDAPPYIRENCWAEREKRTRDADENLVIEFQTSSVWALERDVLAAGGWVRILEPADARENVRKAAEAMAAAHHK